MVDQSFLTYPPKATFKELPLKDAMLPSETRTAIRCDMETSGEKYVRLYGYVASALESDAANEPARRWR
jgi:hypothetical protein